MFVGVRCSLDELVRREASRGDRPAGLAALQYDLVHAHGDYDVECDTSTADPRECAEMVKKFLARRPTPTAFTRLHPGRLRRPAASPARWSPPAARSPSGGRVRRAPGRSVNDEHEPRGRCPVPAGSCLAQGHAYARRAGRPAGDARRSARSPSRTDSPPPATVTSATRISNPIGTLPSWATVRAYTSVVDENLVVLRWVERNLQLRRYVGSPPRHLVSGSCAECLHSRRTARRTA